MAAFVHAGWNLLAKTSGGGVAFIFCSIGVSAVAVTPIGAVELVRSGDSVDLATAGFMAGSGVIHAGYLSALQRGYQEGDLSLVYPLARGLGPLLATIAAIAFFGERPSALALAGAAVMIAAILSLAGSPRRLDSASARRGAAFAALTGVLIAVYTLWDKQALETIEVSPLVYYWGFVLVFLAVLAPFAAARPDDLRTVWTSQRREALGVGLGGALSYVLVLYALAETPVSYVAPAREVSILIGVVLGAQVLSEPDRKRRLISAAALVLGLTALALG